MDDKDPQNANPGQITSTQNTHNEKIIQPSAASIEELKNSQPNEAELTPSPSDALKPEVPNVVQAQQPGVQTSSIYPDATKGIGASDTSATTNNNSQVNTQQSISTPISKINTDQVSVVRSSKRYFFIAFVVLLLCCVIFLFKSNISAVISPSKNVKTSSSEFERYTLSNTSVSLLFYKGSSSQPYGVLVSPSLSGNRLPLAIQISAGASSSVKSSSCAVNSNGSTLAYAVYMKSINAKVNICSFEKVLGGGTWKYGFNFYTSQHTYVGFITINNGQGINGTSRDNLNLYSSDIKTIVGSIQPEN
jgi:hypothetical protein